MKKTVVYFSDIIGTILGRKANSEEDYKKFNDLLATIKQNEQADEIIFSLISTDDAKFVFNVQNMIFPFINQTVSFGKQFFGNGYYIGKKIVEREPSAKAMDITQYIQELSQDYEITSVYYAEDTSMHQEMLAFLAESDGWNQQLVCITPNGGLGLFEVNQLLESNIKERFGAQK